MLVIEEWIYRYVVVVLKMRWSCDVGVMVKEELSENVVEVKRVSNGVMAVVLVF